MLYSLQVAATIVVHYVERLQNCGPLFAIRAFTSVVLNKGAPSM